jgi:hypothetical protein
MLTVENQGGHGAIEVCLDDGGSCTNTNRIAVAQGQCGAGVKGCTTTIETTKSEVADGLKIVWSALLDVLGESSYLATAYTCSPGSKGCTSSKTTHMAKLNTAKTQIQTVIKVDAKSDSITIGGTFSKDMPVTGLGDCIPDGNNRETDLRRVRSCECQCTLDNNSPVRSESGRKEHQERLVDVGGGVSGFDSGGEALDW